MQGKLAKNKLIGQMIAIILLNSILSGFCWADANEDPWEPVNRKIFNFNEVVDRYTLKPIAKGYQWVTPELLQSGISNAFNNLGELKNFGNNVLQLKFHDAGVDSARFAFNSTFGLLGFFDVGSKMGLKRSDQDFGLTFAYWGVPKGPYIVLPFLGPSTIRDAVGKVPDHFMEIDPFPNDIPTRNSMWGVQLLDTRTRLLSLERVMVGDRYIFVRNGYLENRQFKIKGYIEDDF